MNDKIVMISFAINDDNGCWDYKVRRADFGDLIDANPYNGRPAQAEIKDGMLHIGYVSAKVLKRISWYGTMMFEGVGVSIEDAQHIAEYLRKRGYQPESGRAELFDAWEEGKPINFDIPDSESDDEPFTDAMFQALVASAKTYLCNNCGKEIVTEAASQNLMYPGMIFCSAKCADTFQAQ